MSIPCGPLHASVRSTARNTRRVAILFLGLNAQDVNNQSLFSCSCCEVDSKVKV